jgi:hypothetical protein
VVTVSTSKGMASTGGDVKVTPASNAWTEFNVRDVDGTVRIAARKGDVTISDGKGTVTLAQGQETTRDESSDNLHKKNHKQAGGTPPRRNRWSAKLAHCDRSCRWCRDRSHHLGVD